MAVKKQEAQEVQEVQEEKVTLEPVEGEGKPVEVNKDEVIRILSEELQKRNARLAELEEFVKESEGKVYRYLKLQEEFLEETIKEAEGELEKAEEKARKFRKEHDYPSDCCRPCDCEGWYRVLKEAQDKLIWIRELMRREVNGL